MPSFATHIIGMTAIDKKAEGGSAPSAFMHLSHEYRKL